ncbi:MAG: ankyrin repeat domain-containing protein [Pseudomonadota bacterium]
MTEDADPEAGSRAAGYTALIDAVYAGGPELTRVIARLLQRGEDPNARTVYGETPLSVAYRQGHAGALRLLIEHKAETDGLRWTRLHLAAALGDVAGIAASLGEEDPLARDRFGNTPYLVACQLDQREAAKRLRGATPADGHRSSRESKPDIVLAAAMGRVEIIEWLLAEGVDVNAASRYGGTALIAAVEWDRPEAVRLLLGAGADLDAADNISASLRDNPPKLPADIAADLTSTVQAELPDTLRTPANTARSKAVAELLIEAGAAPAEFEHDVLRAVLGADRVPQKAVAPAEFERARHPREGRANPEAVQEPFWEQMIRTGESGYSGHETFGPGKRPYDLPPVWSHNRFGMTTTRLPDGRWVQIAGEHEDHYDPDFHIYNDVILHDGRGGLRVFLYPHAVFPPTDFHSATLVGDRILLIGSLSYPELRRPGETQVMALSLEDFAMTRLETTGDRPGWIHMHRAARKENAIHVWGGKVTTETGDGSMNSAWSLDLDRLTWRRL